VRLPDRGAAQAVVEVLVSPSRTVTVQLDIERLKEHVDRRIAEQIEPLAAGLRDAVKVLRYVSAGRGYVDVEPYPDALARRALGALDDAGLLTEEDR
jgi:hypothetical protein